MPLLLSPTLSRAPFTSSSQRCRRSSRNLVCQAASGGEGPSKGPAQAQAAPRRQITPPDFNPDVKMEKMTDMGEEVWEGSGVVQLEEIDLQEEPFDLQRAALLAAGDAAALLLFAAIGRASHGEPLSVAAVWDTAAPFALGWFLSAPFTGAFGKDAQGWDAGKAAGTAAKSWVVALPLGHVIRALSRGYLPPTPFLMASLGSTLVLLVGWRTALAAATPEPPKMTAYERMLKSHKKMGGPLEFFRFIQSMTRRW